MLHFRRARSAFLALLMVLISQVYGATINSKKYPNKLKTHMGFEYTDGYDYIKNASAPELSGTPGAKKLIWQGEVKKWEIDLKLNTELFSPEYIFYDPDFNANKSNIQDCFYHGRVVGAASSFVTFADCYGYQGMIILNAQERYTIHSIKGVNDVLIRSENVEENAPASTLQLTPTDPPPPGPKTSSPPPPNPEKKPDSVDEPPSTKVEKTPTAPLPKPANEPIPVSAPPSVNTAKSPTPPPPQPANIPNIVSKTPAIATDSTPTAQIPSPANSPDSASKTPSRTTEQIPPTAPKAIDIPDLSELTMSVSPKDDHSAPQNRLSSADSNEKITKRLRRRAPEDITTATTGSGSETYYDLMLTLNHMQEIQDPYIAELYIAGVVNMLQHFYKRYYFKGYKFRLSGGHYLPAKNKIGDLIPVGTSDTGIAELLLMRWRAEAQTKNYLKHSDIAFLLTGKIQQYGTAGFAFINNQINNPSCTTNSAVGFSVIKDGAEENIYEVVSPITHELGHIVGMMHSESLPGHCPPRRGEVDAMKPTRVPMAGWTSFSDCLLSTLYCTPSKFKKQRGKK